MTFDGISAHIRSKVKPLNVCISNALNYYACKRGSILVFYSSLFCFYGPEVYRFGLTALTAVLQPTGGAVVFLLPPSGHKVR